MADTKEKSTSVRDGSFSASRKDMEGLSSPDYAQGEIIKEPTKRGLKTRHAQMIALGGTIGTGLFVSTGVTLNRGGPAFILLAFLMLTGTVFCVVTAITTVSAYLPISGGTMNYYGHRNVSDSLGFAMGWLYWYSLGILVPYEITAAGLVIDYWGSPVNVGVWITVFIVVIVLLNTLPVHFYGESEFWFASLKVFLMLGLLLLSFILFWGGGPDQDGILGFHYWKDPGATNTYIDTGATGRFLAFLSTLVRSSFPFTFAPELLVVTGGEMQNPRRNLPKAAKRYFFRLIFFYIGSVLAMGVICPYDDPSLTDGGAGAKSSPFVVGIENAGIHSLGSVVNGAILISAWSSGNSFLYMSSRSLYSLAIAGNAPSIFKKCTRNGVPYNAVAVSSLFSLLAYLNCGSNSSVVFDWFVNLTNTSAFISWICCAIVYLRFRKACQAQALPKENLPYTSWWQPWGSYVAIAFFTFLSLINGFDVFFPGNFNASSFLTAYIGIPIFLVIYLAHRIYKRHDTWLISPAQVDLQTGVDIVIANEGPEPEGSSGWKGRMKDMFT